MKNLILKLLFISLLFTGIISAQKTEAESNSKPVKTVTEGSVKKIDAKETENTEAKNSVKNTDVKETAEPITEIGKPKVKFGSKAHRATLEKVPGKIESTENILWKTCLSLAAVIAIILLIFSVLKKVNKKLHNVGTDNPLRVHSKLVIDSKNYLALIRVYEEEILISVGPGGTTTLAKYALVDKDEAEGTDFENILNSEGQSVVPMSSESHISSIDLTPVKELNSDKK